jgi:hypothetical protein
MARYGYGMSVSGSRTAIVASGGAAPSGIVVDTTIFLIITFGDTSLFNYERIEYPEFINYAGFDEYPPQILFQRLSFDLDLAGGWALSQYNNDVSVVISATNPSTNPLIIPTTGWTYTLGTGPTVTITAA